MGWGAAAVVASAAISAAVSTNIASHQRADEWERWRFANTQQANAAYAEADAIMGSANAEANAIMGQATAEADAYRKQAAVEKDLLFKQADEARAIAYDNIEKMKSEADESLRRLEADQQSWEAKARAKASASGVRREGSTQMALDALENENDQQYNWLGESYKSGLDVATKSAESEYSVTRRQGLAALEAGNIKATATMQAGMAVADAARYSGQYSASSMRKKGDSYLALNAQKTAERIAFSKATAARNAPKKYDMAGMT